MCGIFNGFKIPFFAMENMFPEFVDKFRFWVLEYLIYYVKFKM